MQKGADHQDFDPKLKEALLEPKELDDVVHEGEEEEFKAAPPKEVVLEIKDGPAKDEKAKDKLSAPVELGGWRAAPTEGGGDCAFHAVFGRPNEQGRYICENVEEKRQELKDAIIAIAEEEKENKDQPLIGFVYAAIRELAMSLDQDSKIGERIQALQQSYQDYLRRDEDLDEMLWEGVEALLREDKDIMGFVDQYRQDNMVTFRKQFYHALTVKDGSVSKTLPQLLEESKLDITYDPELGETEWQQLEVLLRQNKEIKHLVESYKSEDRPSFRSQFNYALTLKDGALIPKTLPQLLKAKGLDVVLKNYNKVRGKDFTWRYSSEIIREYADYISQPGQWLLPCEVAMLASAE